MQLSRRLGRRHVALDYAALYEAHAARASTDEEIVGSGDFDRLGRIELAILVDAGLRPTDVLVDFGCGSGRLALHAVSFLRGGAYIGIEISETILRRAKQNVAETHADQHCRIAWLRNRSSDFPLPDGSVDIICAFSVFTHMEHEDSYRYLADALRVVRPGGRFVFSCLPLELEAARQIFLDNAALSLEERWRRVRNVTTSREFMDAISVLAGWRVASWSRGDEPTFFVPGLDERAALGQSVCVLERPRGS
jgi:SAM-dependent methyltransferase